MTALGNQPVWVSERESKLSLSYSVWASISVVGAIAAIAGAVFSPDLQTLKRKKGNQQTHCLCEAAADSAAPIGRHRLSI